MFLKWGFQQYFVVLKYFLSSILFCTLKRLFLTLLLEVRPVRDWRLLSSPVDVHCAPMQTQFTATCLVACCELHITHKQVCCRAALRCAVSVTIRSTVDTSCTTNPQQVAVTQLQCYS